MDKTKLIKRIEDLLWATFDTGHISALLEIAEGSRPVDMDKERLQKSYSEARQLRGDIMAEIKSILEEDNG